MWNDNPDAVLARRAERELRTRCLKMWSKVIAGYVIRVAIAGAALYGAAKIVRLAGGAP